MTTQTYLVTGAGRGLGKGFAAALLQRPNTLVIAAMRTPSPTNVETVSNLPKASDSKLIVVKIESESETDPFEAVENIQKEHGVSKIDVVIANAAIGSAPAPVSTAPVNDFRRDFQVNAMAPLLLFQATWPLLQKSKNPKFIGVSTCLATIGDMETYPWPTVSYGATKATMNYIVRKMHFENKPLVAFVVHPGWVQTDSGNSFAKAQGRELAPDTVEDSVNWILEKVDESTKDKISGTFQFYGRDEYAW